MRQSLPATFLERTPAQDIEDDISRFRGTTIAESARVLESLCRMAAEFIAQHEDPQRALDWQDSCSAETEALLARLRKRYQHGD